MNNYQEIDDFMNRRFHDVELTWIQSLLDEYNFILGDKGINLQEALKSEDWNKVLLIGMTCLERVFILIFNSCEHIYGFSNKLAKIKSTNNVKHLRLFDLDGNIVYPVDFPPNIIQSCDSIENVLFNLRKTENKFRNNVFSILEHKNEEVTFLFCVRDRVFTELTLSGSITIADVDLVKKQICEVFYYVENLSTNFRPFEIEILLDLLNIWDEISQIFKCPSLGQMINFNKDYFVARSFSSNYLTIIRDHIDRLNKEINYPDEIKRTLSSYIADDVLISSKKIVELTGKSISDFENALIERSWDFAHWVGYSVAHGLLSEILKGFRRVISSDYYDISEWFSLWEDLNDLGVPNLHSRLYWRDLQLCTMSEAELVKFRESLDLELRLFEKNKNDFYSRLTKV